MTELMRRRRALMAAGGLEPTIKNGYEDATYDDGTGKTVYTVESNALTIASWTKNVGRIRLNLKKSIEISAGDTVRMIVTKRSGSVSGYNYPIVYFNSTTVFSSKLWGTKNTPFDESFTAGNNMTVSYISMNSGNTTSANYTDYVCIVSLYINGTKVVPED